MRTKLKQLLLVFSFIGCCVFSNEQSVSVIAQTYKSTTQKIIKYQQPYTSSFPSNNFFAGAATIFEDNNPRFNTYGVNLAFTHRFSQMLGLTADGGIYSGSSNGIDYTKFQLLGGVSWLPEAKGAKVAFSPHLLAGISDVISKYKSDIYSFSNNNAGLAMAAGTNVIFPFNNNAGIAFTADYNPTFSSGGIKNNFRLGLGILFHTGGHRPKKILQINGARIFADLKLINPGLVQVEEQFEVLTGDCHDKNDPDEPGPETVIAVINNNNSEKILAPKNVGTCPIEIFCVDIDGHKIPGTSIFLEPGESVERYISPVIPVKPKPIVIPPFPPINPNPRITYRVARIVFQCSSRKEGSCKLQIDHWDQNYHIPRGKIVGNCDNKNVLIGEVVYGSLNWIKNTGTCPVEVFSSSNGKVLDKPTVIAPGAMLPVYNPARSDTRDPVSVFFKCPMNNAGTCEIELDSSVNHSFPMPKDHTVGVTSVFMVLKGTCDGKESTISVTNGKALKYYGLKNLGTCPLEIYELDEEGRKSLGEEEVTGPNHNVQLLPRTTVMTIEPGKEADVNFISSGFGNRIVMKCMKSENSDCSLQILDRSVEYLAPEKNPPTEPPKFKPVRSTITGECSNDADDKKPICFFGGNDDYRIKWITNTGNCPIEIFSSVLSGGIPQSSRFRLNAGQTIESYNAPKNALTVYFRCLGGGNSCSLEYEHPVTHQ